MAPQKALDQKNINTQVRFNQITKNSILESFADPGNRYKFS